MTVGRGGRLQPGPIVGQAAGWDSTPSNSSVSSTGAAPQPLSAMPTGKTAAARQIRENERCCTMRSSHESAGVSPAGDDREMRVAARCERKRSTLHTRECRHPEGGGQTMLGTPPSHLSFGTFELDLDRFELRRAGRVLAIQRKPLDLLLLLVRQHGRVV